MDLIIPESGLIIWQVIIFSIVLFVLGKFAWKPILNTLKAREESIDESLKMAEKAREEMENLKADNEKLLNEARTERDRILKEATKLANEIKEQAKIDAEKLGAKLIEDAKATIDAEKKTALKDIKEQVAQFSLQISEKLIRKNLASDSAQKELLTEYLKDLN